MLTVYGIETNYTLAILLNLITVKLQQCLPFTVLKRLEFRFFPVQKEAVATVLTVYGIETPGVNFNDRLAVKVATVLTVYGIETFHGRIIHTIH